MARIINYNVNPDKNMESKNISNTWSSDDYVTSGVSCCFSPKCWSKSLPSTMWCWSLICLVWYIGMVGPHGCAWSVSPGGSIICSMSSCCTSFCNQFTVKTLDGGGSNNRSTVGRPSKLTFLCPWGFYVAWCIISWCIVSLRRNCLTSQNEDSFALVSGQLPWLTQLLGWNDIEQRLQVVIAFLGSTCTILNGAMLGSTWNPDFCEC